MGVEVIYRRLPAAQWERLLNDPAEAEVFLRDAMPGIDVSGFDMAGMMQLMQNPAEMQARAGEFVAASLRHDADPTRVSLHKYWPELHYLLTGEQAGPTQHRPEAPLHNVVMGGRETPLPFCPDYGPVRVFDSSEIRDIAQALASFDVDGVQDRRSVLAWDRHAVHEIPLEEDPAEGEYQHLLSLILRLQTLFQDARDSGELVVVFFK